MLPVAGDAEVGDVGEVVATVPGVEEGGGLDGLGSAVWMLEGALPLLGGEGVEEHDPAGVEGLDEGERPLWRGD